jgi:lipopolysaccharide/colanic/teichoic acid biosynthesis glycosyltransferase
MPLKPGFIGPWWLDRHGRPTQLHAEIEADLHYARTYSIWLDLRILAAVGWVLLAGWTPRTASKRQSEWYDAQLTQERND